MSAEVYEKKEHKGDDSDGSKSAKVTELKEGISPEAVCKGDDSSGRESAEGTKVKEETSQERLSEGDCSTSRRFVPNGLTGSSSTKVVHRSEERKILKFGIWAEISPSLAEIEKIMSFRVKKRKNMKGGHINGNNNHLSTIQESEFVKGDSKEDCKDEVCISETLDDSINALSAENAFVDQDSSELFFQWKELQFLVHGGVPKDIRGEV